MSLEKDAERVQAAIALVADWGPERRKKIEAAMIPDLLIGLNNLRDIAHRTAYRNGFYDQKRDFEYYLMGVISEVEELRREIAEERYENEAEEAADVILRMLDFCGNRGYDIIS